MSSLDGVAVVDKPSGWTSHDVVAKARGLLHTRRIGHAGTLDPDATGVLVLGIGRVTRLLRYLTALTKSYTAEIVLGVETTTLDASGEIVATHDMGALDPAAVRVAAAALTGELLQVPPMVSAVRVGGRRLHELARQGIEVPREPRPVTVHRFELTPTDEPDVWRAEVSCSSGTYVRSLAADLGRALGGGAHLRALRRTAVGSFVEAEAVPLERLGPEVVLAPAAAVRDLPAVTVGAELAIPIGHGRVLPAGRYPAPVTGPTAVLGPDGTLLAVVEPGPGDTVRPAVVLAGSGG